MNEEQSKSRRHESYPASSRSGSSSGGGSPGSTGDLSAEQRTAAREQLQADFPPEIMRLLLDLSSCLQKYAMYPKGHPAVEPGLERVRDDLAELSNRRMRITITVGREQLAVGGARTEVENPLLRSVAERLHAHHVLAVTFKRGVQLEEIEDLLDVLSHDLKPDEEPLALRGDGTLNRWPHIHLQPLDYDPLKLADEDEEEPETDEEILARAELPFSTEIAGLDLLESSAEEMATRIENRLGTEAMDRMIALQVFQLGEDMVSAGGKAGDALKRRVSDLVMTLEPQSLGRVLTVGDEGARREKFLVDASQWMDVDAVLRLIRTAAEGREGDIGPWLLRLMQKMGRHAPEGSDPFDTEPDTQMRELVHRLVDDWRLEDPRPGAYSEALQKIARQSPVSGNGGRSEFEVEASRVLQMTIELDEPGEAAEHAVGALLEDEGAAEVLSLMERAPEKNRVAEFLWDQLSTPEAVGQLLRAETPDFGVLDRIIDRLGPKVADPMLEVFIESKSRSLRRKLFDRLAAMGPEVAPLVAQRADDERWWVQRNALSLLVEIGEWPEELELVPYLKHEEPRVRAEAFKLGVTRESAREWAVCTALRDSDQRLVTLGLAAAEESCPAAAETFVLRILRDRNRPTHLRAMAIRALADHGSRRALQALVQACLVRRFFFWRKLAPASQVVVEAVRALARHWPDDHLADEVLRRARASDDPDIRRAARGETPGWDRPGLDAATFRNIDEALEALDEDMTEDGKESRDRLAGPEDEPWADEDDPPAALDAELARPERRSAGRAGASSGERAGSAEKGDGEHS